MNFPVVSHKSENKGKLELKLIRTEFTEESTIGELYSNGEFECYTLEDKVRPKGVKVYGKTAIPYGIYEVVVTYSPRFKRKLPRLLNVPMFEGILIHPGNTAKDTSGCILVGRYKGENFIGQSRLAFNVLMMEIEDAESCSIVVTNENGELS